jgi:hypothetical protein
MHHASRGYLAYLSRHYRRGSKSKARESARRPHLLGPRFPRHLPQKVLQAGVTALQRSASRRRQQAGGGSKQAAAASRRRQQ